MDALRFLDILGFVVGLVYLWLEYRASIWLWVASIVMPAVDMVLYYKAGLYADFGMAIYYCLAAVYGFVVWRWKEHRAYKAYKPHKPHKPHKPYKAHKPHKPHALSQGISHFPWRLVVPTAVVGMAIWGAIWWMLTHYTNSTVPVTDAFTTAVSIVALWALARKYAEQWLLWLVVDAICCSLYIYKGIPFKACIYGLYTVVAVFGYRKWLSMMNLAKSSNGSD